MTAASFPYPELPSEDIDPASCLLLPETPLDQVLPVLPWQRHIATGYRWIGGTGQDVRLRLVVCIQPVGVDNPQRAVMAHLIIIS